MAHRTERRQTRIFQLELAHALEKLDVLWVRGRKTAFNIINAECIKPLHNAQLILNGKGNSFALLAIAQRAVVRVDFRFLKCLFTCSHSHSTWVFSYFFIVVRVKGPCIAPIRTHSFDLEGHHAGAPANTRASIILHHAIVPRFVKKPAR